MQDKTQKKVARRGRPMIPVIRITNPFNPREHTREEIAWQRKKTLGAYFPLAEAAPVVVSVNGKIIPSEKFSVTYLDKTDNIVVCPVPTGGGGGKQVLSIVAMIAVAVTAPALAASLNGALGFSTAAGSFAMAATTAGIVAAGSLLVASIFAPPKPTISTGDTSASYGADGAKNTSVEGIPVPVNYGQFRMGGNILGLFTENVADDNQILYMLLSAGEGPIASISDVEINDNPIADYGTDVEIETRLGGSPQATIPWFSKVVVPQSKSIKLDTDWTYHTTTTPVDMLRLDFAAPSGLFKADSKSGKTNTYSVPLEAQYRPADGSGDWTAFASDDVTGYSDAHGRNEGGKLVWRSGSGAVITDPDALTYLNNNSTSAAIVALGMDLSVRVPVYSSSMAMTAAKRSVVRRSYTSTKLANKKYEVRVRRTTEDSKDDLIVDDVYLTDVNEIVIQAMSYPNTALLALKIKLGSKISSAPNVTFMHGGRLIQAYGAQLEGAQPGWYTAASKNPAWVVWDMLTHRRYGAAMPTSRLDFPAFQEWAAYCEEQGYEWNGPIDTEMNVWDAAQLVLRVGHSQLVNVGTRYTVVTEKPGDPVMMFSVANMIEGTFKETWLGTQDRANEIDVTFFDKTDKFKQRTVKVYDPAALTAGAKQRTSAITLYGVTDYETAYKEAQFQLNLNRYILRTAEFSAPLEAVACSVGDLIYIQHDMTEWAVGGRFESGSSASVVQLDRPVKIDASKQYKLLAAFDTVKRAAGAVLSVVGTSLFLSGYDGKSPVKRIQINGRDMRVAGTFDHGSGYGIIVEDTTGISPGQSYTLWDTDVIEESNVVVEPGERTVVTLQTPLSVAPAQFSNWMFGEVDKIKQAFRVRAVTGTHEYKRDIAAIEYKPEVYDFSRYGTNMPTIPPKDGVISAVRGLTLYEETYVTGSGIVSSVVASWNAPAAGSYAGAWVFVQKNDGPMVKLIDAKSVTSAVVPAEKGDVVKVQVQAYDIFGKASPLELAPTATHTVVGEVSGIDVGGVTGAGFTWSGRDCKINWRYNSTTHSYEFGSEPTGADAGALDPHFKDYEIRVYDKDHAVLRRTEYTVDNSYTYIYDKNFADGITRHLVFEVRMRDTFNNLGAPATLEAYNPPPRIVSASAVSTFDSATIRYTHSDDPDFTGVLCWLSQNKGNVADDLPDNAYLVYNGPDSQFSLPSLMFDAEYYYRLAAVDAFGPTELVFDGVRTFKTTNLNVDAIADGVLKDSQLIPALQSRIDLIDADEFVAGSVNARINYLRESVFKGPDGLPAAYARIQAIDDVSSTSTSANARTLASTIANVGQNTSSIQALNNVSASSTSAAAKALYQVTSRLNNVGGVTIEQAYQTQANLVDGLKGQYTVKIDNNGYVAGFGLASYSNAAGQTTSEFIINADKFGVIMPSYPGVKPFTIGTVNGVPRVILSNALIGDASISSAMIGNAQINSLKIQGEAVTVPIVSSVPENGRRGRGKGLFDIVNEGYIKLEQTGMIYVLATAGQHFPEKNDYWTFQIRVNGQTLRDVGGTVALDAAALSVCVGLPAGTHHVELAWAGEKSVRLAYNELFMMGVKK
ncbi:TipJ family phage tail tip protein [Massilia sp. TN1-12]|uniref:TipJ family phage tail tip protein n=1 Tax=Massilia paldalensis TaxID=3377675 RepID=UPI00384ABF7C